MVPSSKNTTLDLRFRDIDKFRDIFTIFSCKPYDAITDPICIIEKCQYLLNEKRYFKKKTSFFCILKGPSNKQKNFLCHIHLGCLNCYAIEILSKAHNLIIDK